jgi:hypothetical protein
MLVDGEQVNYSYDSLNRVTSAEGTTKCARDGGEYVGADVRL